METGKIWFQLDEINPVRKNLEVEINVVTLRQLNTWRMRAVQRGVLRCVALRSN
jgi:hypothetical protein